MIVSLIVLFILWCQLQASSNSAVWDNEDYVNAPNDEGRYDEEVFEVDSNCSGCLSWIRDGSRIGRATHASDRSQRVLFTDFVRMERNDYIAERRHWAESLSCWRGYTPDMCCANGGWDVCFDSNAYTFENCCLGWATEKDTYSLELVRSALNLLFSESGEMDTAVYPNAFILSAMIHLDSRLDKSHNLTCVELGVFEGGFSHTMLSRLQAHGEQLERYYLVDTWLTEHIGGESRELFLNTMDNLAKFWELTRILQEPSHLAAKLFENESVDFVFVDADHGNKAVYKDLVAWWPKVRKGGHLAGHDYVPHRPTAYSGVLGAVQAFANEYNVSQRLIGVLGNSFVIIK